VGKINGTLNCQDFPDFARGEFIEVDVTVSHLIWNSEVVNPLLAGNGTMRARPRKASSTGSCGFSFVGNKTLWLGLNSWASHTLNLRLTGLSRSLPWTRPPALGFGRCSDGRSILYAQNEFLESNIMLVTNLP